MFLKVLLICKNNIQENNTFNKYLINHDETQKYAELFKLDYRIRLNKHIV